MIKSILTISFYIIILRILFYSYKIIEVLVFMNIFENLEKYNYEELVFFNDTETGLKAITCIHSTKLGPSLGGTRLWNYAT